MIMASSPLNNNEGDNNGSSSSSSSSPLPIRGGGRFVRRLSYAEHGDGGSHYTVLTRLYGSVWPKVLPYCVLNIVLTLFVYLLRTRYNVDLTNDSAGHKFMSVMMSFLVVTRLKITYDNYMASSKYLTVLYESIRELAQWTCTLSQHDKNDAAARWRHDVLYAACSLLRVTMAVLEFKSNPSEEPWNVPELSASTRFDVQQYNFNADVQADAANRSPLRNSLFARMSPQNLAQFDVQDRTKMEEAFRAPIVLAYNLRREIIKQRIGGGKWLKPGTWYHPCNEELRLLGQTDKYMKAYHGLIKLTTCPVPFPLVQMAKTFLFVWVFTLPLVLCHDDFHMTAMLLLINFLITFGFVGLEFVAMELSDCFGNDPVDFDNLGYAEMCFEDVYITVYKTDGKEWAAKLRSKVLGRIQDGNALEQFQNQYRHDWESNHDCDYDYDDDDDIYGEETTTTTPVTTPSSSSSKPAKVRLRYNSNKQQSPAAVGGETTLGPISEAE